MASCPNCDYKLKFTDWRPNCPQCNVNLVYFGQEEKLQEEADKAELEYVHLRKRIDRLKASFVGHPLAILRIFLSLLPLGALMLPLCSVSYSGPFIEQTTKTINAVSVVNAVSSLNFDALFTMMDSKLLGTAFTGYFASLVCLLLSVVMVLVSLIALMAANGPKGNIRNFFNNTLAIALACAAPFFFMKFANGTANVFPDFFSAKLEVGVFVYIGAIVLLLVLNVVIAKKKIPVQYKQCYIGGIPYEEYIQMVEAGVSMDEIHAKMDVILAEKEAKRLKEVARKAAEKKAREEELLRKNKK